ncbi:VOC family protein [Dechloromonas sp. ZY10]|uniref:VOC family protein n=1 Tax=Dechloromonas aquae TaxID=2664436 RepID=UPI003528F49A
MNHPNFLLLYVANPVASAAFYTQLLGAPPVEASPTFAMFALDNGMMLGLWARETVAPKAVAGAGSSELAFAMADDAAVEACYAEWAAKGIVIAQTPTRMDFGFTFLGLDPDGHRLRVFSPSQA